MGLEMSSRGIRYDPDLDTTFIDLDLLQPHQRKFYETVEKILQMGITPTPRVVNEALGKAKSTTWNGPLVQIRTFLLEKYGYERVFSERSRSPNYRWKKKK